MKITRIELCHPVNRPGKHDDNFRELSTGWSLQLWKEFGGVAGVHASSDAGDLFIPLNNIRSIS